MEYTKDMIFGIRYDEVHNTLKTEKMKWTSRFAKLIKKHKIITMAIFSAIIFIGIDIVLLTNFFNILTAV